MPKWTRCKKCTKWFHRDEVSQAGCPACDFRTSRCETCGGSISAMKSVLCHFAYWRTRGGRAGGHLEKLRAWADENQARITRLATKQAIENLTGRAVH